MITASNSRIITAGKPITMTTTSRSSSSMTTSSSSMTTSISMKTTTISNTTMITISSLNKRQTNTTTSNKKMMTGTTKPSFQGARSHSKNRPSSCQLKSCSTARTLIKYRMQAPPTIMCNKTICRRKRLSTGTIFKKCRISACPLAIRALTNRLSRAAAHTSSSLSSSRTLTSPSKLV